MEILTKRERKPLAVILDYDDTIVQFINFIVFLHNKEFGTCLAPSDIKDWDFGTLNMKDARGNIVTGDHLIDTYRKYEDHGLYAALPVIKEARFALELMKDLKYKIIIITARKPEYEQQTILNLRKHDIIYDEIYFEHDKVKKIRELQKAYNIKLFADDKLETVINVHERCNISNICLINMSHNSNIEIDSEIKRINTLFEAVRYLR